MESLAFTLRTSLTDQFAAAAATWTSFPNGEKTLLVHDLATPVADRASDQASIRFGACTLALGAGLAPGNLQVGGNAAHRIFKADFKVVADIFSALRTPTPAATRTEDIAEQITQNVFETAKGSFVESLESTLP